MDQAQEVFGTMFVADYQASKVLQPRKQTLDLPPAAIAPQGATILGGGLRPVSPVGGDQLDSRFGQFGVQRVTIVRLISDQPGWEFRGKGRSQSL
jgi:hypothetical protein